MLVPVRLPRRKVLWIEVCYAIVNDTDDPTAIPVCGRSLLV